MTAVICLSRKKARPLSPGQPDAHRRKGHPSSGSTGQTGRLSPVPAFNGDADAGQWRGIPPYPGDAGALRNSHYSGVYAGRHQTAQAGAQPTHPAERAPQTQTGRRQPYRNAPESTQAVPAGEPGHRPETPAYLDSPIIPVSSRGSVRGADRDRTARQLQCRRG
ncbi:hypothetical protein [Xenorhabdus ehlersii]|uniref:hypothetical protein n=1 Tax=Xenorhabdus ehlersii TaxID=290111 RepID=UPI003BB642AE